MAPATFFKFKFSKSQV